MTEVNLDIQELVKQSGVARRTIYFYVQQGILPPPHGAGLSAHYTPDHLLRLKLIPLLRQQGLRLDEIRQRLEKMEKGEMEGLLASVQSTPIPQKDGERKITITIPEMKNTTSTALLSATPFIHYNLPGGITLTVPDSLAREEQGKVQRLLKTAVEIFMGDENGRDLQEKEK